MSLEAVDTTREIVMMRVRGHQWPGIADKLGLTVERCKEKFNEHLLTSFAETSEEEWRYLQLLRLEHMISFLWGIVQEGDAVSEGKQTSNLLNIIQELNNLLGLHKDKAAEAKVRLTEAQTALTYEVMRTMRTTMLESLLADLRTVAHDWNEDQIERMRTWVEASWAEWHKRGVDDAIALIDAKGEE